MLTNRGEEVEGFACATVSIEALMREFDTLPRPLRDFLNDASCEWSVSHVAGMVRLERAGFMPSGWALWAMKLEDDKWRAAAYQQRGIST
jgi:hypothetical protein